LLGKPEERIAMKTCRHNHALIYWPNPELPCPVCDVMEDLARVVAEIEALKAQVQSDIDERCG